MGSGTGKTRDIICKLLGVEVSRNIFVCLCSSIETSACITWGPCIERRAGAEGGSGGRGCAAAGPPRSAGPRPARPPPARRPPGAPPLLPPPQLCSPPTPNLREPGRCPSGAARPRLCGGSRGRPPRWVGVSSFGGAPCRARPWRKGTRRGVGQISAEPCYLISYAGTRVCKVVREGGVVSLRLLVCEG